jgi:hypothetical protein
VLERGFRYHRRGEGAADADAITPYDVPVFSHTAGLTSCRFAEELFNKVRSGQVCALNWCLSRVKRCS